MSMVLILAWALTALFLGAHLVRLFPICRPRSVDTLWSKGVAFRCDHQWADNYWIQPTEARADASLFASQIEECRGLVYLRLGSRDERPLDIETFSDSLQRLTRPVILLTLDGDSSVPGDISEVAATAILEHPMVIAWFTQNWDGTVHSKLNPFPIGLDFHTRRISMLPAGLPIELSLRIMAKVAPPISKRQKKIFCDFHLAPHTVHNGERLRFQEHLRNCSHVSFLPARVPQLSLWKHYTAHAFVASTHGNGLDCHRTWEALLLGCIVVTRRSSLDSLYRGLPVVIVEDWTECEDPAFLERCLTDYKPDVQEIWKRLKAERWIREVRNHLPSDS